MEYEKRILRDNTQCQPQVQCRNEGDLDEALSISISAYENVETSRPFCHERHTLSLTIKVKLIGQGDLEST